MAEPIGSGFTIVDSSDLDHYRAQPGSWNTQLSQLGKDNFRSHIRSIEFPDLKVWDNRWGGACQGVGQSPDGWLMLGSIDTSDGADIRWCGRPLNERTFACTSTGRQIEFNTERQAHSVVILIRPRLMEQTCGSEAVEFIKTHQGLCFDFLSGSALIELIVDLLRRYETQSHLLQQPAIVAGIRSNLLRALEECFAGLFQQDESIPSIREAAVHAAVLHVEQAGQKTSAWHMAQAAGVSQKTLELAFRECMGMTPGRYLKVARLNGVHHQLALSPEDELSVTQVLAEWGFTHPGRFAGDYRQLFNELPSQTLRRPAPLD